jgi:hypothetical protein
MTSLHLATVKFHSVTAACRSTDQITTATIANRPSVHLDEILGRVIAYWEPQSSGCGLARHATFNSPERFSPRSDRNIRAWRRFRFCVVRSSGFSWTLLAVRLGRTRALHHHARCSYTDSEREGRFQSAERAVPTQSFGISTKLLSA